MAQSYGNKRFITELPTTLRVTISRLGVTRYFNFTEYGDEALERAIAFRDSVLEAENLVVLMHSQPRTVSKGGACSLAGVELKVEKSSNHRAPRAAFTAYYKTECGRYRRRSFSIRKYGYVGAFERALEARIELTKLPVDTDTVPLPRPSLREFVVLRGMAADVPSPHMEK